MPTKLTRRQAALGLATTAAALAQTPVPATPQTPEEERKAVQTQLQSNAEALAKVNLPQATEPAFVFRA